MARHRRAVIFAWVLVLVVCMALYPSLKKVLGAPDYGVDGSQSSRVEQLLNGSLRGAGSEQDVLAFYSRERTATSHAYRVVVARVLRTARAQPGVVGIDGPYGPHARATLSADRHAAVARVALAGNARQRFQRANDLQVAVDRASGGGVQARLTGFSAIAHDLGQVETTDAERAETIGVPVALLILLVALGAFGAAILPLLQAGAGLLLTYGVIALLGRVFTFDAGMLTIVTMVGVGIGIDYSLFIVSRFREELARTPLAPRGERRRVAEVVGASIATSGRTVLYSGVIVGLSLMSLLVIHAPIFREFAVGALVVVTCTLLAALTLLPATLAQLNSRINMGSLPARLQPADVREGAVEGDSGWARWALAMMRRPVLSASVVVILLLASMSPILGIRYGINLALASLSKTPSGEGAEVLEHSFSQGLLGPIVIVLRAGGEHRSAKADLAAERKGARVLVGDLRADRGVAGFALTDYRAGVLLSVTPATAVDSPATDELVKHIRADLAPAASARSGASVLVGGWTAQSVDASAEASGKLPLVLALTLGMALIFLLVVFRSVVLPIKAVLMNLLATGATLGLVVLIFQDGHGSGLLGFTSPGYIQTVLPMSMFVLLFGLSMDYEVFLIRRMQETWLKTGDNRLAVASGVEHTARPITAAAAIMVAVFGSFLTASILELKQFGFALAAAIAIDATLIRLVLVPSLMCLLGARNWWLPAWAERMLPRLELD